MKREFSFRKAEARRVVEQGDLVVPMALASEAPVERWYGIEILDMGQKSVRLARLNDGANVLFNHNPNELRGVHERSTARVDADRVLRSDIRITSATQAGRDAIALVESGMLTKASAGYRIHKVIEQTKARDGSGAVVEREIDGQLFERIIQRCEDEGHRGDVGLFRRSLDAAAGKFERCEDELPIYRIMDWEPFETSFVTIPADETVGVARQIEVSGNRAGVPANPATTEGVKAMPEATGAPAGAVAAEPNDNRDALQIEEGRQNALRNLAKMQDIDERIYRRWIADGTTVEDASEQALKIKDMRKKADPITYLDQEVKEVRKYSLLRALRASKSGNWAEAGLEREASQEIAKRIGREPGASSFFVPLDVQQRDLTVASASGGGYLKGTENQSFIELLRNRMVVREMGATVMSGLRGDVTIPKQTAAATAYWLADEATGSTESAQTFGQLALTPKTVSAHTQISRKLMLQSDPSVEQLVLSDLGKVLAIAVDLAAISGTGTEQPTGITNTGSIGGFTGTSLAAAGLLDAQADVAAANALSGSLGYVTTPAVAALLMARPELPSTGTTRMWQGNMKDGTIFGFKAMSSNQMAAATMIFGDWSQLVIAEWGVLELATSESANTADFQKGITTVRAFYSVDVGVRYAGAFSLATSIT